MSKKRKNQVEEKRDNWFVDYHDIPELGIEGKRKINDRIQHYDRNDFLDATVIDLGCNMGQTAFQAEKWGAKQVVGVEYDAEAISRALDIKEKLKSNVNFVVDDLDSNFLWNSLEPKDVVMFLAVIDTHELENRYGILSKACSKTKKVMYFEGHGKQPKSKYLKNIVDYTDFSQIVYKGNTPINRPFFRCTRDKISSEECIQKIVDSKHNKIAVVGKSLSGKTTIRNELLKVNNNKYNIIDDLKHWTDNNTAKQISIEDLNKYDKMVCFDYRALEYYEKFDAVFFLTANEDKIGQRRDRKGPMRSPVIKNFEHLKEIYTVGTY